MADTKQTPKDGLALVIGGIFILALVFATYNYFNKSPKEGTEKDRKEIVLQEGELNGDGVSMEQPVNLGTGGSMENEKKVEWVANDYKEGDIEGARYTVKSGDTLWEIAEAVYGSGFQWTKILEANKSSIGFLPNGSQALIMPGQVLVLP